MKILLVKLSSLGDVIHSLPVLSALKTSFPEAEIDWAVEEPAAEILENHPFLERLLIFPRTRILEELRRGSLFETRRFLRFLRQKPYDVVLDLQGLLKSGLLVGLARGKVKIGFANHREGSPLFYNFKLPPYDPDMHAVKRYLLVLKIFGIEPQKVTFPLPPVPSLAKLKSKFGLPERFAVFIPVARWPSKLWTISGWRTLAYRFAKEGLAPIIVGSEKDAPYVQKILSEAPGRSLCGKIRLLELASLLQGASLIVSVDTGPMHLAAALGKTVIALFGPTAPWRTGPFGEQHQVIFKRLPCSPCFQKVCSRRSCMEEISPQEILNACGF